jgi:hypothetical protein
MLLGGMERHSCRRVREDQPSLASVHRRESEDVLKEDSIGRRIRAVDHDMRTHNHDRCPLSFP